MVRKRDCNVTVRGKCRSPVKYGSTKLKGRKYRLGCGSEDVMVASEWLSFAMAASSARGDGEPKVLAAQTGLPGPTPTPMPPHLAPPTWIKSNIKARRQLRYRPAMMLSLNTPWVPLILFPSPSHGLPGFPLVWSRLAST